MKMLHLFCFVVLAVYSQLVLSPCFWVTDDIPCSPQYFESLSSSWVFILVWMNLKENGQRRRLHE